MLRALKPHVEARRPDRRALCERIPSSFIHRVSPGKWFALYLLLRMALLATACTNSGPADGEVGGKCRSNGCTLECDTGAVCRGETCVASSSGGGGESYGGSSNGGTGCGFIGTSPHCNPDEMLVGCSTGSPQFAGYSCRAVNYDDSQGAFCCAIACDGSDCDAGEQDAADASMDDGGDDADAHDG